MKRMVSLTLAIIIALTSTALCMLSVYAETNNECSISIDDKFADNRVIVVMNNKASLNFNDYTVEDFKQYGCKNVRDLSTATSQKVKRAMQNIADHVFKNVPLIDYNGIDFGVYNQIICLDLDKPGKENVISIINALNERDDILYAYPDFELTCAITTPDDNHYDDKQITYYNKIDLEEAWDITTGSDSIIIGVIDTGIDASHPDFDDNIDSSLSMDFSTGVGIPCTPSDNECHGTACAGVVAAQGNNSLGISGVCWNAKLSSLKVIDSEDAMYSSYVVAAINYAEQVNIPILSMSLAWTESCDSIIFYNHPLSTAINNYSGLFVCAAGNDDKNIDDNPSYPADYCLPNMITVGATTADDELLDMSNYGSTTVDIFAPGYVLTTVPIDWYASEDHSAMLCDDSEHVDPGFHWFSGTSFAAPMVAGVAALMLSVNPNLSPKELKHIIMEMADPVSSLTNLCVSGGRLNAYEAVNHAQNHTLTVGVGQNLHSFYCDVCGYTKPGNHDLYMHSEAQNAYHVKCATVGCSYEVVCSHTPVYEYANTSEHTVSCPNGCYTDFYESHGVCTYEYTESKTTHNATCQDCGYTFSQPHSWIQKGSKFLCSLCGMTSTVRPPIVVEGVIPEVDEIVASLPSSNEEDDLTE